MRYILVFLFVFLFKPCLATQYKCQFNNLIESKEIDVKVVVDTYHELLSKVGEGIITPEVMESIYKSGDPFTLPSDLILTSGSLQEALIDFRSLLNEKLKDEMIPFQKEILKSLISEKEIAVVQEKKQADNEKKDPPFLKEFYWKGGIESLFKNGKWLFTISNTDSPPRGSSKNAVRYHDGTNEIELRFKNFPNMSGFSFMGFNKKTGELYCTDGGPKNLAKMKVFDEFGDPVKKIELERIKLDRAIKNDVGVAGFRISDDGRYLVLFDHIKDVMVADLTEKAPKGLNMRKLIDNELYFKPTSYGFLSNSLFYSVVSTKKKSKLKITDLTSMKKINEFEINYGYQYVAPFNNGKQFFVVNGIDGKKSNIDIFDVDLASSQKKYKPVKWLTGHAENYSGLSYVNADNVVDLPDRPYYLHFFKELSSNGYIAEIRLVDKKTLKPVLVSPLRVEDGEGIEDFQLSEDKKTVFITFSLGYSAVNYRSRTVAYGIDGLIERIER